MKQSNQSTRKLRALIRSERRDYYDMLPERMQTRDGIMRCYRKKYYKDEMAAWQDVPAGEGLIVVYKCNTYCSGFHLGHKNKQTLKTFSQVACLTEANHVN